ncbi:MAG: hypothetical protein AB1401_02315 [Thermodesulfobacteriota bacterium]
MKRTNVLFALLVVLFLAGCVTSKFTQTGEAYPPYEGIVKVLTEPPKDKKYVEVGWVASSGGMIHEWTNLIEAMQKEAASKGANAIILNQQFGLVEGSSTKKSLMAIAVRILE